jgi:serine/threonine protein kinase/WD40 repeat protein
MNPAINACPSLERLSLFEVGGLDEHETNIVASHIDACEFCQTRLLETRNSDPIVDSLLRHAANDDESTERKDTWNAIATKLEQRFASSRPELIEFERSSEVSADEEIQKRLAPTIVSGSLGVLAHYEVLEKLGEGGMGVVFRAIDVRLHREIALKVVRPELTSSPDIIRRFYRESKVIASVSHEHSVPIYDVGEWNGCFYFSMKLVTGPSLSKQLARGPLDARIASRYIYQVSLAIAHAHSVGIVHRDIKPANVLIDETGHAYVSDFGLAKLVVPGANEELDVTRHGHCVGSPSYMSPEQALGASDKVGPATDIYSIGATLYALLTGRPPFQSASILETLEQIAHETPVSPKRLNTSVPRDLDTICMKCLSLSPNDRFRTATELADELKRFLEGVPIRSRPVPISAHVFYFIKKNPAVSGLATILSMSLVTLVVFLVWGTLFFRSLANSERNAKESEAEQRIKASEASWEREIALSDMYSKVGVSIAGTGDSNESLVWFANAAKLSAHDKGRELANRIRISNWSRYAFLPRDAVRYEGGFAERVYIHPSGRYWMAHGKSSSQLVQLWGLDVSHECTHICKLLENATAAKWSQDGDSLSIATSEHVSVYAFPSMELQKRWNISGTASHLCFDPLNKHLAVAINRQLQVFSLFDPDSEPRKWLSQGSIMSMAFNPKGDRVVVATADRTLDVASMEGSATAWHLQGIPHESIIFRSGLPPLEPIVQNEYLVAVHGNAVSQYDSETGTKIRDLVTFDAEVNASAMTASNDGRRIAIAAPPSRINIYNAETGEKVTDELHHRSGERIARLEISGDTLVSAGHDHTARLWNLHNGKAIYVPFEHSKMVSFAVLDPTARLLITADRSGLVRSFELPRQQESLMRQFGKGRSLVRVSADGRWVVRAGNTRVIANMKRMTMLDIETGESRFGLTTKRPISDACIAPDGQQIVVAIANASNTRQNGNRNSPSSIQVFGNQGERQKPLFESSCESPVRSVDFRPDGAEFAVLEQSGRITQFDAKTYQVRKTFDGTSAPRVGTHNLWNGAIRYSNDGRHLVAFGLAEDSLEVWDSEIGERLHRFEVGSYCVDFQFSANGDLAAAASADGDVFVWEIRTWNEVFRTKLSDRCGGISFSRRGDRIAAGCLDGTVRVYSLPSGELAGPPVQVESPSMAVDFSIDGEYLFVGTYDGKLALRHTRTSQLLGPPIDVGTQVLNLKTLRNGDIAVGGVDKSLILDASQLLEPCVLDSECLSAWSELVSGKEIANHGTLNLNIEQWLERWTKLRYEPRSSK